MTREEQFRKDIIGGFKLIIPTWCKTCTLDLDCQEHCLKFRAASAGHLNILKEWKLKENAQKTI